ncbi:MAG TPA: rhomboid family intramembrane serine protease, partial [Actinobacteria bacterium]|nr:rhomboid family intramembrane serine protease [Actinomycetota bacterium]
MSDPPTCLRHPDRVTMLSCSRCGAPICAECMVDAAVGQLCPDCAAPRRGDRHRVVPVARRSSFAAAPVSYSIIGITLAVFLASYLPGPVSESLLRALAQVNVLVLAGEWWRIFTAALLHAGITHVGFNMYALYVFGPALERQVGSPAFAALYLACAGVGGAVSTLTGQPTQVSIGASGAIFGLFGAWLFVSWKLRGSPAGRVMLNQLLVLLALNVALAFVIPRIDWRAHAGGMAAGLLIAFAWSRLAVGRPRAVLIRTVVASAVAL